MSKMWSAGASSDCVLCLTYIVSSAALNSTPTNQVLCLVEEMLEADNRMLFYCKPCYSASGSRELCLVSAAGPYARQ